MSPESAPERATLGAGCFWCLDAAARRTPGILSSIVGYAGGPGPAPSYWAVHGRGDSPYVEAVQLEFDAQAIGYAELLELFFRLHDATVANRDGANMGPEYHSTIFVHSESQRRAAHDAIRLKESEVGRTIVTAVRPFTTFFPAEPEHQDFFNANPDHPYCTYVIIPKLRKVSPT